MVLGSVGRNVGAGMTGGVGYFYDPENSLEERLNKEIVKMQRVESTEGEAQLKAIIERHFEKTGSEKAEDILNNWDTDIGKFWQVYPPSEINNPVVKKDAIVEDNLRVSASAPDGSLCFLPVGGQMSPDQTTRCAD